MAIVAATTVGAPLGGVALGGLGFIEALASNTSYGRDILDHLPRGEAWPRDEDTELAKLLRGNGRELSRAQKYSRKTLEEVADPRESFDWLDEWEEQLGLPDCGALAPTIDGRRAEAYERLITRPDNLSDATFIALALGLGYTITIDRFAKVGMRCDSRIDHGPIMNPKQEAYCWRINGPLGGDSGDEDDDRFKCRILQFAPLHKCLIFNLT